MLLLAAGCSQACLAPKALWPGPLDPHITGMGTSMCWAGLQPPWQGKQRDRERGCSMLGIGKGFCCQREGLCYSMPRNRGGSELPLFAGEQGLKLCTSSLCCCSCKWVALNSHCWGLSRAAGLCSALSSQKKPFISCD